MISPSRLLRILQNGAVESLGLARTLTCPEFRGFNQCMGMFQVRVKVANPADPTRFFEENFWVDTGALYSFVPEDRLEEIGLLPVQSREVVLADGRRDRRLLGEARLTVEGIDEPLTCPILFAPKGSLYLLGATALETFGVDADPVTKRLKPVLAVIGGFLSSR